MATQPATQREQERREPQLHQVHILYLKDKKYAEGQEYEKGQDLEVYGYPPKGLQKGDAVVFIPFPPGELKLTFEYGSNFTDPNTSHHEIVGWEPQIVKREMTDAEFNTLKAYAEKEKWSERAFAQGVKENAFPFMCKLTPSNSNNPSVPYKGGFPRKP